jgi:hypothetical protein
LFRSQLVSDMFASPPPWRASAFWLLGYAVSDSGRTSAAVANLQHGIEPLQVLKSAVFRGVRHAQHRRVSVQSGHDAVSVG